MANFFLYIVFSSVSLCAVSVPNVIQTAGPTGSKISWCWINTKTDLYKNSEPVSIHNLLTQVNNHCIKNWQAGFILSNLIVS